MVTIVPGPFTREGKEAAVQKEVRENYDIYFESGIDDFGGWLNVMKQFKLVSTAGAWYTYKKADGTDVKFLSKDFQGKLEADPELKDEIYNAICDAYILTYKPYFFVES